MSWNIDMIREITEEEAKKLSLESECIKGHNVYFVDFDGGFGYSVLVYKNNHHIHYANDYQLHHYHETTEELKKIYINRLHNILFTESEILEPLHSYDEYNQKSRYLRNYYGMQQEYITIFCINPTEEQKADFKRKIESMTYNPVSFAYYDDAEFVKHHIELMKKLEEQKEQMNNNFEYQKNAFLHEMNNHEYGINWQADYDVLSAFGTITYTEGEDELTHYFDELNFTDTQRKAYYKARKEYFAKTEF